MKTEKLYKDLMSLTRNKNYGFYFNDFNVNGVNLRIFSYRLTSSSSSAWFFPEALECRGIAFTVDNNGNMIELVSRPMEKFFNLDENDLSKFGSNDVVEKVMDKADGSLISTCKINDSFILKSKSSVESEQAVDSFNYLKKHDNIELYRFCDYCSSNNMTVNLEWCSPKNRVVLDYKSDELRILNVRDNYSGEYVDLSVFLNDFDISKYIVDEYNLEYEVNSLNFSDFSKSIKLKKGIEGVVIALKSGKKMKIKTDWYIDLHCKRDVVCAPKKLCRVILNNNHDDLISLFSYDNDTLNTIKRYENHVFKCVNNLCFRALEFYNENKDLSRKDFAIKLKSLNEKSLFFVCIKLYTDMCDDFSNEYSVEYYKKNVDELLLNM